VQTCILSQRFTFKLQIIVAIQMINHKGSAMIHLLVDNAIQPQSFVTYPLWALDSLLVSLAIRHHGSALSRNNVFFSL
jgi:hypothetical protein